MDGLCVAIPALDSAPSPAAAPPDLRSTPPTCGRCIPVALLLSGGGHFPCERRASLIATPTDRHVLPSYIARAALHADQSCCSVRAAPGSNRSCCFLCIYHKSCSELSTLTRTAVLSGKGTLDLFKCLLRLRCLPIGSNQLPCHVVYARYSCFAFLFAF